MYSDDLILHSSENRNSSSLADKSSDEIIRSKRIEKKILPKYFEEVINGDKTFELRKDEDNILPGDFLVLREWSPDKGYSGRKATRYVSYILRNSPEYGLAEGYCIIAIQPYWINRSKMNG